MRLAHLTPCRDCPFRRDAAPGRLGAAAPADFIASALAGVDMPCHLAVDYEDPAWRDRLDDAPRCAGSLIFLRNTAALPRDPALRAARALARPRPDLVFRNAAEFLAHHDPRSRP